MKGGRRVSFSDEESSSSGAKASDVQYSVPVNEAPSPGEGRARINAFAAHENPLLITKASTIVSLHQNFLHGVNIRGDCPFLGTRPVTNGLAGPYIWQTYNEVHKRVKNMGSGLMSFPSLHPATATSPHVGIFALNRAEWVIAEQACFMHCLITVPLFDMLSRDALKHILKETQISTVVATRDKARTLMAMISEGVATVRQIVLMDGVDSHLVALGKELEVMVVSQTELERIGSRNPIPPVSPSGPKGDDVGTICYTSGTTGIPKGALLTHTNMLALMKGIQVLQHCSPGRLSGIHCDDVYISYLLLAHAFERAMMVSLIYAGASIGFYQGDTLKLMDDVGELRPTIFASVPRLFNRIHDKVKAGLRATSGAGSFYEWAFRAGYAAKKQGLRNGCVTHSFWDALVFSGVREKLGGRVRMMLTGAAPIGKNVLDSLRICFSAEVYEGYGLTETCSSLTVTDRFDCSTDQVGTPVPGCKVKLVDVPEMNYFSTDRPFPRGEICVNGPNVFKGYFNNPEETAKALDAGGWFHTGDVGEWDAQGRLRIIDRKKSVFKLSQGEYIAPEKIESVLKRSDLVAQVFIHGSSTKPYIVAVIVPARNSFMTWATKKQGCYHKNFADLCVDEDIRKAFTKAMEEHGKAHGLKGFENVKAVYLEKDADVFTIEGGLLTPIFKLKRFAARDHYKEQIEEMYNSLPAG